MHLDSLRVRCFQSYVIKKQAINGIASHLGKNLRQFVSAPPTRSSCPLVVSVFGCGPLLWSHLWFVPCSISVKRRFSVLPFNANPCGFTANRTGPC